MLQTGDTAAHVKLGGRQRLGQPLVPELFFLSLDQMSTLEEIIPVSPDFPMAQSSAGLKFPATIRNHLELIYTGSYSSQTPQCGFSSLLFY